MDDRISVDQYRRMTCGQASIHELHFGIVVTLERPKMRHAKLQSRLVRLLRPKAEHLGVVETEVAFRALPEYDLRGADVAYVSQVRWDDTDDDDNLRGSPEIVIEVLSPSNTKAELQEKAAFCLSTGALEFWVVDPKHNTVSVTSTSGSTAVYRTGDQIPLALFSCELDVASIFNAS